MKVRKLAVALALAGGLGSGLAHALGMGEGRILTNLNEPLRAEIELSEPGDLSADQIKVSLAPDSDFERAGVRRMDVLHRLEFEVVESDSGFQIEVTSDKPIREPFLNFLVELTWPNGRLLREYSFLVDPPSRSSEEEAVGPNAGTGSGDTGTAQQRESEAQPERQTERSRDSGADGGDDPREFGPTGGSDTLWGIAGEVSPSSDLSRHQVMLAIQDANPDAFANNNINELRRGRVLRIPSEDQIRSRSRDEALQQVTAQNERHQQSRGSRQADAGSGAEADAPQASPEPSSPASEEGEAEASAAENEDELRILVADEGSDGDEGTTAGMGDGEGEERLAAALEELDRAERDREELSDRLADLEGQLKTMTELIELKDDQLAEMEQRLADARDDSGESSDADDGSDAGSDAGDDDTAETADSGASGDESAPEESAAADEEAESSEGSEGDVAAQSDQDGESAEDEDADPAAGAASDEDPEGGESASQPEPDQGQDTEQAAPTNLSEFFQRIINDPRYQIGAGALGIALLALLWGLARRNAAREQAFYDQLKDVSEPGDELSENEDEDVLGLGESGDEAAETDDSKTERSGGGTDDALAEADVYLAYGRHGQAVQHLEDAISSEPSRVDLRLKLLEVYADSGQAENFEKQYRELSAFNDDEALRSADELRSRLDSAGEDLSLDELTAQLKTGTGSDAAEADTDASVHEEDDDFDFSALEEVDDLLGEETSAGDSPQTSEAGDDAQADDFSFDFDLSEDETLEESLASDSEAGEGAVTDEASASAETEEDVADLGFSMDDLELEEPGEIDDQAASSDEDVPELDMNSDADQDDAGIDFEAPVEADESAGGSTDVESDVAMDDLDLGIETDHAAEESGSATGDDAEVETGAAPEAEASSSADFDDSFLDELDAELDRVTEEEADEPVAPETSE
ncbi:MAG: FimV/HubP family polar landmark protein, partial [Pseudomonadota bacterium]